MPCRCAKLCALIDLAHSTNNLFCCISTNVLQPATFFLLPDAECSALLACARAPRCDTSFWQGMMQGVFGRYCPLTLPDVTVIWVAER